MSLLRRLARPALAAPFIVEGVRTAISPEREISVAPAAFAQVDRALQSSPAPSFLDARSILRLSGAVAAGAGFLYATGRAPRLASGVLLATTTVGLAGRKKVWELKGAARTDEITSILKDAGLLGGIMLALVDREGRPSLGYQVGQFVERTQKQATKSQQRLEKKADALGKKVQKKADELADQFS